MTTWIPNAQPFTPIHSETNPTPPKVLQVRTHTPGTRVHLQLQQDDLQELRHLRQTLRPFDRKAIPITGMLQNPHGKHPLTVMAVLEDNHINLSFYWAGRLHDLTLAG